MTYRDPAEGCPECGTTSSIHPDDCSYLYMEDLRSLVDGFLYERCPECEKSLSAHVLGPGPFGKPFAWCAPKGTAISTEDNAYEHTVLEMIDNILGGDHEPVCADPLRRHIIRMSFPSIQPELICPSTK